MIIVRKYHQIALFVSVASSDPLAGGQFHVGHYAAGDAGGNVPVLHHVFLHWHWLPASDGWGCSHLHPHLLPTEGH